MKLEEGFKKLDAIAGKLEAGDVSLDESIQLFNDSVAVTKDCLKILEEGKSKLVVIKKDGTKELFDRSKILSGILKACEKRPVNAKDIVTEIESEIQNSLRQEISTKEIGELVMEKLRKYDDVSYVRFASVYREFKDLDTFLSELNGLKHDNT